MVITMTISNKIASNQNAILFALDRMRFEKATLLAGLLQQAREELASAEGKELADAQLEVIKLRMELEHLV